MIGSRAWWALIRRNLIYRRRNLVGSFFELCLPIAFVGILVLIKGAVEDTASFSPEEIPANFPTNNEVLKLFSFTDYVTALQADHRCVDGTFSSSSTSSEEEEGGADKDEEQSPPFTRLLGDGMSVTGIYNQGYNWQVPFVKCDSRKCKKDGQDAVPFCEFLALGVAPSTIDDTAGLQQAEAFIDYIYGRYPVLLEKSSMPFNFDFVQLFNSNELVEEYVVSEDYGGDTPKLALAVIFDGKTDPTINYNYAIRVNSTGFNSPEDEARPATTTTPPTNRLFETYAKSDDKSCLNIGSNGGPSLGPYDDSCTGRYAYNGFLTIQRLIHDFIIDDSGAASNGYSVSENGVQFVPFPSESYITNGFYATINAFAPLLITLGLLYPVAAMVRYIVLEKELRQKELMKMMSVKESDIGWSWFVFFFVFHIFTALGTTAVSTLLYESSAALLLFLFWEFTFVAMITFCFFLSSLFSKATRATLVSILIFFFGYFLTLIATYENSAQGSIFLVSLHPVGAFAFGIQEIGRLEDSGVGLTVNSMIETDSPSGYTFTNTLSYLLFDMLFWGVLSWYTNRVFQGDFGQSLRWYFPFTLSYWCPSSVVTPPRDDTEMEYPPDILVEPVSTALKEQGSLGKGIEVRNLTKVFGEKTAVNELKMNLYSGQITALLGHNGAGKTTTISMLTGMLEPTSGYATIAGKDIRSDMDGIRQGIGICLQHDCLFPELTVREHVAFFARVKGMYARMSRDEAEEKVDASIEDVALGEKRNTLSKNLSGGMMRKLSVAIAFCGDSETVLLDEPTSGMDPFSRRFTWDVIRKYRQNRCIILSTHFMDEADILGDRIAIMAEGQLRCIGSSLFLKKTYGVGYQLTIEKKPLSTVKNITDVPKEKKENSVAATISVSIDQKIEDIVIGAVEGATLLTNVGTEMILQLPLRESAKFKPMFDQLEDLITKDEIVTYGVGITTLDEVFLLVARGATPDKTHLKSAEFGNDQGRNITNLDNDRSFRSNFELESNLLFSRHVSALFKKRAMNFKRDKKAWCCTTILPSIFVLIGFLLFAFVTPQRNLDPIVMDLDDLNVQVSSGQNNPIIFNTGTNFSCEIGKCIYDIPIVASDSTNELYYFCGTQSYVGNGTICSLAPYEDTISQITQAGAQSTGVSVMNVNESSHIISETAYDYAATQYGGIFYLHDSSSVIIYDQNSSTIDEFYSGGSLLEGSLLEAIDGIDIENIGPMLESLGVDTSAYNITELLNMGFELDFLKDLVPTTGSVVGMNYSEAVISKCLQQKGNYTTEADCLARAGIGYVIQYNYTAIHAAPLYQMLADEAIVREAIGDNEFKIQTVIHPLPITTVEDSFGEAENAFTAWFLIILSFPFISGSFATFVVQERQSKAKHLQTVAGVKPTSYWLSTFLWDIANYSIPCLITIILMFAFDVSSFTTTEDGVLGGVIALLILFGPASASYCYCVSFMFSSPSICNLIIIISSFLIGFGGTIACFILRLIGAQPFDPKENLTLAATIVEWVLRIVPAFNLSRGLYSIINIQSLSFIEGERLTVWSPAVCFWEVVFLAWQSVVYILLAMIIDVWSTNPRAVMIVRKVFCCDFGSTSGATQDALLVQHWAGESNELYTQIDDDVAAEDQRVLTGGANDDLIVLSQLGKTYRNGKKAVDSLCLGIPPGQCFGLLGINGAGKTTTMGMLTAEFPPSSGDATLAGHSVSKEPEKTRARVGYCPQFDAHFMNLTGREHVELYASIKGIPSSLVKEASASKLSQVGLSEADSDRLAAGYSGGMKRRLSLANATIGNPQIVFLDECSTGVDPVARREIWEMVSNMVSDVNVPPEERTSVILTTHSMEECEALCPRIGIMTAGNLRCLGSAQQLKSKFGKGYQIEMKIKNVETIDKDYVEILTGLARIADVSEELALEEGGEIYLDLEKTKRALTEITSDGYLPNMLDEKDLNGPGFMVLKEAKSPTGIDLDEIAEFATTELRMRSLYDFINTTYPGNILRERQDTKTRFEVESKGVRIGEIFAAIENNKDRLMVAEYGVSQTSLEQVFNMHAAEAEKIKQGTADR
mmetsp:Transcript_43481/g.48976  ORF Transcript_43481/g.48976 Transcript_43481/m.48976 type:complete len:2055 (-) Transcript_43481:245-6409(-)